MTTNDPTTTVEPLSIRITPAGKLYTYVRHALDHLTEHQEQPVELHTRLLLPTTTAKPLPPITSSANPDHSAQPSTSLLPCTTSIPRLISVIEIIKREFLLLNSKEGAGLWQYNRLGVYTREEVHAWEEQQRKRKAEGTVSKGKGKGKAAALNMTDALRVGKGVENKTTDQPMDTDDHQVQKPAETATGADTHGDQVLRELLTGSNHPKMSHTPYMSVILSTRPLPHLLSDNEISYQPVKPLGKKKRRRALTNAERRLKKTRGTKKTSGGVTDGEEEEEEVEEPEEVEVVENDHPDMEPEEPETMEVEESLPKPAKKQKVQS